MYAELTLSTPHRKSRVEIIGGGENVLYTSIPSINGQLILLKKDKTYTLTIFDDKNVFTFNLQFIQTKRNHFQYYYAFEIMHTSFNANKRRDIRKFSDIPAFVTHSAEPTQVCRIVDISLSGAKLECIIPIKRSHVSLHMQGKNSLVQLPTNILWESSINKYYYYGVQFLQPQPQEV